MIYRSLPLFVICLFMSISCASSYTISTKPPGAIVSSDGAKLGKTPLTISANDIKKRHANGVLLDIESEGYQKVKIWLPDEGRRFDTLVNLNPFYQRTKGQFRILNSEISRTDLNRLVSSLMETQKKLLTGGEVPKGYLENVLDANPALGSAYYLNALNSIKNGKKEEGVDLLKEAMRYSAKESEFLQLYNEVKGDK